MASSLVQVRIDDSVKKEAQEIFQNLGLTMSGAIKLFLNRVIIEQGLPFPMNINKTASEKKDVNDNTDENTFNVIKYLESFEDSDVYGSSGVIND